jgi:hypothetical protein
MIRMGTAISFRLREGQAESLCRTDGSRDYRSCSRSRRRSGLQIGRVCQCPVALRYLGIASRIQAIGGSRLTQ